MELEKNKLTELAPGYQKNKEQFFGVYDRKEIKVKPNELDFNDVKDYHNFKE